MLDRNYLRHNAINAFCCPIRSCQQGRIAWRRRRRPESDRATAPQSAEVRLHEGTALGSLRPRDPALRHARAEHSATWDGLVGVSGPLRGGGLVANAA